ncbi:MAG: hypothetical protein SPI77_06125 [Corynebacterium sp.]|nr:hypothetical protein [Corynebacterium sp.]
MTGSTPAVLADPADSLVGWVMSSELQLRTQLSLPTVTWVGELPVNHDELEQMEYFWGTFLARQVDFGATVSDLLAAYPALTMTTLVFRASRMISAVTDAEEFVREYCAGVSVRGGRDLTDPHVGGPTVAALAALLADFGESLQLAHPQVWARLREDSTSLVAVLALHAGVTGREVGQLLSAWDSEAITAGMAPPTMWDQLEAAGIAAELPVLQAAHNIDPQRVGEILDAVDLVIAADPAETEVQVPSLIGEKVRAELQERPVPTVNRTETVGPGHREDAPRLIFKKSTGKVCLRLPEQILPATEETISWRVSMGEEFRIYRTMRPWGMDVDFTEQLDITVRRQVSEVAVADLTTTATWTVPVVSSEDPVLIFSALTGQNLTSMRSLHHAELAVIAPAQDRLVDFVTGKDLPVSETLEVEGWEGWNCRIIRAFNNERSIQLVRSAGPSPVIRAIDPVKRVHFIERGSSLEHIRSLHNLHIHSDGMYISFLSTQSRQTETWYLSISTYAGVGQEGEEITAMQPIEVPAEGGWVEAFDLESYDSPWVGEYLVRLKGPRGESFRHEYALVEGAWEDAEYGATSLRIPERGGLSAVRMQIHTDKDKSFTVDPEVIEVSRDEAGAYFTIATDEGDQMPLRFFPARLRFQIPIVEMESVWRTTPVRTCAAELRAAGTLRIRGINTPRLSLRSATGRMMKSIPMMREDNQRTWVTNFAPIYERICHMASGGTLQVEWDDLSLTLVTVDSHPPARSARVEGTTVLVDGVDTHRSFAAWVWALTAPWRPATTLPTTVATASAEGEGIVSIDLPENLVGAGPLAITLNTPDPFNTVLPPLHPAWGHVVADQPGHFRSEDTSLDRLAEFLAARTAQAEKTSEVLPAPTSLHRVLWDEQVFSAVPAALFTAHPAAALNSLADALILAGNKPPRFISAGLAPADFAADEEAAATGASAAAGAGWITALAALSGAPTADDEAVAERIARAVAEVGQPLATILSTGRDASLDSAAVDAGIVQISRMPAAQQEQLLQMFFANAALVPGKLLDDSSRLMAIYDVFTHRDAINELFADTALITTAATIIKSLRSANRKLYTLARIRFDKLDGVDTEDPNNRWVLAPVCSLVLALAARMQAHSMLAADTWLTPVTDAWARCAAIVPDLIAGDLVSAEAMVLAQKYPGLAV